MAMSSGFFGFYAHCGVMAGLEEAGLRPSGIYGSSAGALIGGCWAAGVDSAEMAETLMAMHRKDFWDPRPGWGLLAGGLFGQMLRELLPVATFEETRVPVSLSLFDIKTRRTVIAREGLLEPAIRASCAVPLMFHPVTIDGRAYWDGGVSDRPGIEGAEPGERVLFHHLASRSPWRRKNSASLRVPQRDNLVALVIEDLPRLGPFSLEVGKEAWKTGFDGIRVALDEPVGGVVRVNGR